MVQHLLDLVRAEVSGERALDSVREIARHHRIQSTPGYDAAAAWLAGALREAGLQPEIELAPGDGRTRLHGALLQQGWECTRAIATLHGARDSEPLCDFAAEPLSIVQRSAAMSGRFPIVSVGEGTEPAHYEGVDVRGCVVLASGNVHRVHALAHARGAAGLLTDFRRLLPGVRTENDDLDAIAYTSFWWSERSPRGWGFLVSPRVGRKLRLRLESGEVLELDGEIAARAFDIDVPLVTATIGAGAATGREILVMGHLCHPRPGANDNASGAAAVLECARTLAALERSGAWRPSQRAVRFLWMPEWNGTLAWLAADRDRANRLDAAINLDMVGEDQSQCGSTFQLEHPPHWNASFAESLVAGIRRDWIAGDRSAAPRIEEVRYSGGSDHAVLIDPAFHVPCPMLIQWPDRYYHSSQDTPDRCDPRALAMAAGIAATYAATLSEASPNRLTELQGEVRTDGPFDLRPGTAEPRPMPKLANGALVPRRRMNAPLDLLFHLLPGWDDLPDAERERWRRAEQAAPRGRLAFELAWSACDGVRDLDRILELVVVEMGMAADTLQPLATALQEFFDLAAGLGIAEWKKS